MFNYILLAVSVCANVTGGSVNNHYSKSGDQNAAGLYNLLISLTSLAVVLLSGIVNGYGCSSVTLVLGLIFGLVNGGSIISRTAALSCGPMALTTLITSCSLLIPTFFGTIFYKEELSAAKIFGVAVMIAALILIIGNGKKENEKKESNRLSLKWLILCFTNFLCIGSIGVMQKVQQNSDYSEQTTAFLAISFVVSIAMSMLMFLPNFRQLKKNPIHITPSFCASGSVTGVCNGLNHVFNLFLSGVIPAVIFFPLVNGCGILFTGIIGILVFKEKVTVRQIIGFFLGIASILIIGLC